MSARVRQLQPEQVQYKGYTITLTHRPKINDWTYSFTHTHTMTISNTYPRYETALKHAKKSIDILDKR